MANIIVSVWQDADGDYNAAFVKGQAEVIFSYGRSHRRDEVMAEGARVAIEFDVDLHVMGRLADAHEVIEGL
jgi:hypothetical protein